MSHSPQKPAQSSSARTLAEWTTLLVSAVIVGGLALFLLADAMHPRSNIMSVQTQLDFENVAQKGEKWVLPVEVRNNERQNLREVHLDVTWQQDGKEQTRELTFDYLSSGGSQRAYLWFERDPRELKPKAEATYYLMH